MLGLSWGKAKRVQFGNRVVIKGRGRARIKWMDVSGWEGV